MKKHSKIFRFLTFVISFVILFSGNKINAYAAQTGIECVYSFCSNNILTAGPYKYGTVLPSSIPVFGGAELTGMNSTMYNPDCHYVIFYCSDFGTSLTKKKHTFSVASVYHRYTTATDEYKLLYAGDYIENKFRNDKGEVGSVYSNGVVRKFAEKSDEELWHFRKYLCGNGALKGVTNKSSGDAVTFDEAKPAIVGLGGCGESEYFAESHNKVRTSLGHTAPCGQFLYGDNDISYSAFVNELVYDDSVKGYRLPNTNGYIKSLPDSSVDNLYQVYPVYAYGLSGGTQLINYYPQRMICVSKDNCSLCGWEKTIYAAGYAKSEITARSSTSHHIVSKCQSCGEIYRDSDEAHSFAYSNYSVIYLSDGSSTQHSVTRTCKKTVDSSSCGYSDTISENHYDKNGDNVCDGCGYTMSRFSVTVPAKMALVMSADGSVYSADNAEIINNSTASVTVKSVTLEGQNGWRIVPYLTEMANQKVDSKLIGFSIRDEMTTRLGSTDTLSPENWNIPKNENLPLPYNAVVSATSAPIENKQVLNVTFVIDWSDG